MSQSWTNFGKSGKSRKCSTDIRRKILKNGLREKQWQRENNYFLNVLNVLMCSGYILIQNPHKTQILKNFMFFIIFSCFGIDFFISGLYQFWDFSMSHQLSVKQTPIRINIFPPEFHWDCFRYNPYRQKNTDLKNFVSALRSRSIYSLMWKSTNFESEKTVLLGSKMAQNFFLKQYFWILYFFAGRDCIESNPSEIPEEKY